MWLWTVDRRRYRDEALPRTPVVVLLGRLCVGAAVLCWFLLLSAGLGAPVDPRLGLPAVTGLAALACWCRASLRGTPDRPVWLLFAVGLTAYAGGYVLLFFVTAGEGAGPVGLNLSDCVSLVFYPACGAALAVLTRRRAPVVDPRGLLDAIVVALATSAGTLVLTAAIVPTMYQRGALAAVYAAAYPVGTLALLVLTGCGLVVASFRVDRVWVLLLAAFAIMSCGQLVYAVQSAAGTFGFGTPLDAVFTAGPVLVAAAAWSRPAAVADVPQRASHAIMVLTAAATLLCLGVLVKVSESTPGLATGLAATGVVAAVIRTVLFVRQDHLLLLRTQQALSDPLTGLPNRRALLEAVDAALTSGTVAVLLLFDLDRFTAVNDTLGHAAGDELLRVVGQRLAQESPPDATVARLGGDEFAVLLLGVTDALATAHRLRSALEEPVLLVGDRVAVAGSVGVASTADLDAAQPLTRAGGGPMELLRRADVALSRAKRDSQGVEAWTSGADDSARGLLSLVSDLRLALRAGDQLLVHLQPKCDPQSRRVLALEALVRWQHPTRGLLAPGSFVEAAERAGLLPQLTGAVLELSLQAVVALRRAGHSLPVAVNVGAPDLLDRRFSSRIAQALDRHQLPTCLLRLEVTETAVMQDPERIVRTLRLLRGIGIGISLDDYGTGLSSLAYLRELPIDELKIDRTFIASMVEDRASALIVRSTVELAHGLGLSVVAEGVEDDATLVALTDAGCDLAQGYLLGRPVALADLVLGEPLASSVS